MNELENVQIINYLINTANLYLFQNFPNNKWHYQWRDTQCNKVTVEDNFLVEMINDLF